MSDLLRHRAQMYSFQYRFVPFIAPIDFDPDAQEINIYNEYIYNTNDNRKLVFSVGSSYATTVLSAATGRTYYYGQESGGVMTYNTIVSGTVTWTTGSIKRHVFVLDTNATIGYTLPASAVWCYCGLNVNSIKTNANTISLKFLHCASDYHLASSVYFYGCTGLSGALTILAGMTTIGNNTFYNCTGLTGSLSILYGITSIGIGAFNGCSGLTGNLIIPDSATAISASAFARCTGLNGILRLPYGITTIPTSIISECLGLNGQLSIPASVTSIGASAFYNCRGFTGNLTLPSGLTYIGISAFYFCNGLTGSLTIPNSVTTLDYDAFSYCTGFNGALTIGNPAISLGASVRGAFTNCSGFTALNLPVGFQGNGATGGKLFNFSSNFSAASLNQSILNLIDNFGTLTIGTTNKNRLTAAYPNAVTNAAARGIIIV